jgi:hypothetical protein
LYKYGDFKKKKSLKSDDFDAFFSTDVLCMSHFEVVNFHFKKKKEKHTHTPLKQKVVVRRSVDCIENRMIDLEGNVLGAGEFENRS